MAATVSVSSPIRIAAYSASVRCVVGSSAVVCMMAAVAA